MTQLGVQALSVTAVAVFVFVASFAIFALLKVIIGIRVKADHEMNGLDISEHGVYGYSEGLVATDDHPSNGGNGRVRPDPAKANA